VGLDVDRATRAPKTAAASSLAQGHAIREPVKVAQLFQRFDRNAVQHTRVRAARQVRLLNPARKFDRVRLEGAALDDLDGLAGDRIEPPAWRRPPHADTRLRGLHDGAARVAGASISTMGGLPMRASASSMAAIGFGSNSES